MIEIATAEIIRVKDKAIMEGEEAATLIAIASRINTKMMANMSREEGTKMVK